MASMLSRPQCIKISYAILRHWRTMRYTTLGHEALAVCVWWRSLCEIAATRPQCNQTVASARRQMSRHTAQPLYNTAFFCCRSRAVHEPFTKCLTWHKCFYYQNQNVDCSSHRSCDICNTIVIEIPNQCKFSFYCASHPLWCWYKELKVMSHWCFASVPRRRSIRSVRLVAVSPDDAFLLS